MILVPVLALKVYAGEENRICTELQREIYRLRSTVAAALADVPDRLAYELLDATPLLLRNMNIEHRRAMIPGRFLRR